MAKSKNNKKNKLTAKQKAFAVAYTDKTNAKTFNNALQSAIAAGYSKKSANHVTTRLLACAGIVDEIHQINKARAAKIGHNLAEALALLRSDYANLATAAASGNIAAIQARTAIVRELNDIVGLHKQRHIDETVEQRELSESEQAEARRLAYIRLTQSA